MEHDEMPLHQKAHMDTLHALRKLAMDMIRERSGLHDDMPEGKMSKVMVAAKDKEGLKKGLKKASDVLDEMPEHELEAHEHDMDAAHDGKHDTEDELMDEEESDLDNEHDMQDEDHEDDEEDEHEDEENEDEDHHDMMGDHSMEEEEALHLNPARHAEAVEEEAHESPEEQADEEADLLRRLQELRARKAMR